MSKYSNIWEPVYKKFEHEHPYLSEHIIDWYPSANSEIVVTVDNGSKYKYDFQTGRISQLYSKHDDPDDYLDEDIWRIDFAANLYHRMRRGGFVRESLAEATGITSATIGRYLNGQSTPSAHSLYKIARALKCSVSELMELR